MPDNEFTHYVQQILTHLHYRNKRLKLTTYQLEIVLRSFSTKKYLLIVASTRAGKTFSCAITALIHAMLGKDVVIIAPTFAQAQIMMRTIWDIIYESSIVSSLLRSDRELRQDMITFIKGNRIKILSAHNENSLLGHGADLVIIDEAALIEDHVFEQYILRMIMNAPDSKLIAISTAHAVNFFYRLVHDQKYEQQRDVIKVTVDDAIKAGLMDQQAVEEARKTLTDEQFRAWYYAEFIANNETELLFPLLYVQAAMQPQQQTKTTWAGGGKVWAGIDVGRFNDYTAVVLITLQSKEGQNENKEYVHLIDYLLLRDIEMQMQVQIIKDFLAQYAQQADLTVAVDAQGIGIIVYDELKTCGYKVKRIIFNENTLKDRDIAALHLSTLFKMQQVDLSAVKEKDRKIVQDHLLSMEVEKGLQYKVKKTKRVDVHDDFADALIYAFMLASEDRKIRSVQKYTINTRSQTTAQSSLPFWLLRY